MVLECRILKDFSSDVFTQIAAMNPPRYNEDSQGFLLRLNQRGIHLYIVAKVQVLAHIHTSMGKGKEQKKSGRNTSPNETELQNPKRTPLRLDATSVMTPRGETLR